MGGKSSKPKSKQEKKDLRTASPSASHYQMKDDEPKLSNISIPNNLVQGDTVNDLNPSTMCRSIRTNPNEYLPEYEVLDEDYYIEEAVLMRIKPGMDGRTIVKETTILPFSAIGRLIMIFDGKAAYGSGTLISSKYVLTAAHNLYSHKFEKEPESILFIPALDGDKYPYGVTGVKRSFYPDEYITERSEDYGLIELEKDIGDFTCFMDMKIHRAEEIDNKECSIYGYPAFINKVINNLLYGMNGRISLNLSNDLLRYEIDTDGGQSGSGIYYYSQDENKYYILGVHIKGYDQYNQGTFLTPKRIEQIQEWMQSKAISTKHNLVGSTSEVYGRDLEMNRLRHFMKCNRQLGVICLNGIAGIGKSAIALKFATEAIGSYDYIWWIDSQTEETFNNSLLAFADILQIEGADSQEIFNKLRVYLNTAKIRFLLILDNLEDENIPHMFLTTKGHFIITTRLNQLEFEKIQLSPLSNEASVRLLSKRLSDKSLDELQSLANFLQDLPLGLLQSAAYIIKNRIGVREYIEAFHSISEYDEDYNHRVDIKSLSEESEYILRIVCLGYWDNIRNDMIYKVFRYKYSQATLNDFNYHVGEAIRFNILSYDTNKEILKIHRVLHQAYTVQIFQSIQEELLNHYLDYLYNHYNPDSDVYNKEEVCQIKNMTLHSVTFLNRYKIKIQSPRVGLIYSRIAQAYLNFFFNYSASNECVKFTEDLLKDHINEDSDLANTCYNLGTIYISMGNHTRSEEYLLRCLQIRERILPSDHTDIASICYNLGLLYQHKEEYLKSEEYYLRCLSIREKILLEDHHHMTKIYNNFGLLYYYMGEYDKCEGYFSKALMIKDTILDQNCPIIADIYNNLGLLNKSLGDNKKSEDYFLKCLQIREAILSHDHPDLANIYYNLAELYYCISQYKESEKYYSECLRIRERILPHDHYDLANIYNNLGELYKSMGGYKNSRSYFLKCLRIREANLSRDHPDLSNIYNNLAELCHYAEEYKESEEYYSKCLRIREARLSRNNHDLVFIYNNLGELYKSMGDYEKSEDCKSKLLNK